MIDPEYVKLIPADCIPVFCFSDHVTVNDMYIIREELHRFFGDRKVLAIRASDMQIYGISTSIGVSTEGAAWAAESGRR
jgi:hypothetical protein